MNEYIKGHSSTGFCLDYLNDYNYILCNYYIIAMLFIYNIIFDIINYSLLIRSWVIYTLYIDTQA